MASCLRQLLGSGAPGGGPGLGSQVSGSQATEVVEEEAAGAGDAGDRPAPAGPPVPAARRRLATVRRAPAGASWDERCAALFEDLRKPARVMVARAFGSALSAEEVEDVYANAWTSTLAALRGREHEMSDDELRSYLLTAVANHASKEMRRRRRKPAGTLEDAHAQVLFDRLQPSPDERASGSETGSQARDVLASLPPRRRAVMLLRYGWGLEPSEVCRLIDGLSPRAYRKEITRGVEEMIARFRQLESGEWCATREPLLRDYVAGVADDEERRQARRAHLPLPAAAASSSAGLATVCTSSAAVSRRGRRWPAALAERGNGLGDRLAAAVERVAPSARRGAATPPRRRLPRPPRAAPAAPGPPAPACSPSSAAPGLPETSRSPASALGAIGGACLAGGAIDLPAGRPARARRGARRAATPLDRRRAGRRGDRGPRRGRSRRGSSRAGGARRDRRRGAAARAAAGTQAGSGEKGARRRARRRQRSHHGATRRRDRERRRARRFTGPDGTRRAAGVRAARGGREQLHVDVLRGAGQRRRKRRRCRQRVQPLSWVHDPAQWGRSPGTQGSPPRRAGDRRP